MLDSYNTRLEAAKEYFSAEQNAYKQKLEKMKEMGQEETHEYKMLQLEKQTAYRAMSKEIADLQRKRNAEMVKLQTGWSDQMKLGFRNLSEETRSWGELITEETETVTNKMIDGFTDAWQSWMEGSKSANEATKEFALDTLGYLNKVIMKQLLMRSLFGGSGAGGGITGAIGSLFGGGQEATNQFYTSTYGSQSSLSPFEPATFDKMHSGGIVGKDAGDKVREISENLMNVAPRLHNGLKPDEYPAVLQKGEGVFTKGQMEAMGGGTEVNIIDKRSGNAPQAEVQESQGRDGRKQVQVLIKDEMKKNMNSGSMDKEMKKNYGIGRKSTRR